MRVLKEFVSSSRGVVERQLRSPLRLSLSFSIDEHRVRDHCRCVDVTCTRSHECGLFRSALRSAARLGLRQERCPDDVSRILS